MALETNWGFVLFFSQKVTNMWNVSEEIDKNFKIETLKFR